MSSGRLLRILPVLLILLIAGSSGRAVEADKHSWPLFRGGSLALGVAPGSLPQNLDVLWTFSSEGGWFESTPAIAGGSVFIGSTNGNLYALQLDPARRGVQDGPQFQRTPAVRRLVYIGDVDGASIASPPRRPQTLKQFDAGAEINSARISQGQGPFGSQAGLYCRQLGGRAMPEFRQTKSGVFPRSSKSRLRGRMR